MTPDYAAIAQALDKCKREIEHIAPRPDLFSNADEQLIVEIWSAVAGSFQAAAMEAEKQPVAPPTPKLIVP